MITLNVQVNNSIVPVRFGVIYDLVASVFLGTGHMNKKVQMITPETIKLIQNNSTPVAIISIGTQNESVRAFVQQDPSGLPTPSTEMVLTLQNQC